MSISKKEFSVLIKEFKFRELFNEMGWNNDRTEQPVVIDNITYNLKAVAEKSGFKILVCTSTSNSSIPEYCIRKQIETKVTKLFQEHLIIYCDSNHQEQIWQLAIRQTGKPTKVTETRYLITQNPELLYQKASGIFFEIDEEEHITIVDVTKRVADNFSRNNEKVTQDFYKGFEKEHKSFLEFIKGIDNKINKDWYASLMLNRLMFCYFIQKQRFLDNNPDYLGEKLKSCQEKKGKNNFFSFYRNFLVILFHQGLGSPVHSKELELEIGKIPYLNGGLFDEHELEKTYTSIEIEDKAFENIFKFFDEWNWHLDTRSEASGRDINPDVIGYIFEKYINDRAKMGAYYTKEDITEYISKNSIIPYLFDETKRLYPKAFSSNSEIWEMLRQSGDKYIYDAVKYGIKSNNYKILSSSNSDDLPEDIRAGLDPDQSNLVEKRKAWNKPAPPEIGLPTEIWREVIERRKRFEETYCKIKSGEIISINEFITYNLNIRQFAQDVIENTPDPEFIRYFYKSLINITILDPTCGSGAFLFAALNILETLYKACIMRMRTFVEDEERINLKEKKTFSHKYKSFRDILEKIQNPGHPNLDYFIYKSIILNNLYGVDIMKEAVEIAKLRLFLKLVATVEADYKKPNLGLEPLPDIDFNIRSGNTLVGFANEADLQKGLTYTLDGVRAKPAIEEKCEIVAKAFARYKEIQLTYGDDYNSFKFAKEELNRRLKELNNELNKLLYLQNNSIKYENWLESYQPFHWFAEFYEIIKENTGFDIIIGNPPYVVYTERDFNYKIKDYSTHSCANLYAFCCERSYVLLKGNGKFGMIIPNSAISADKLAPLQKLFIKEKTSWISNYAWRPAKLFEGANMLLSIVLSSKTSDEKIFVTRYYKWYNEFREFLSENISYLNATEILRDGSIPKIPSNYYFSIAKKIKNKSDNTLILNYYLSKSSNVFYYFRAVLYWVKILDQKPIFRENGIDTITGEMKPIFVDNEDLKYILISLISSTTFFIHYITWSSCQVINSRDFELPFNFDSLNTSIKNKLVTLGKKLQKDLQKNSSLNIRNYSSRGRVFTMEKQYFYIKKSKQIVDEIDSVLAQHYGFNLEELDFIINYDIKYRMGKELEDDNEE